MGRALPMARTKFIARNSVSAPLPRLVVLAVKKKEKEDKKKKRIEVEKIFKEKRQAKENAMAVKLLARVKKLEENAAEQQKPKGKKKARKKGQEEKGQEALLKF